MINYSRTRHSSILRWGLKAYKLRIPSSALAKPSLTYTVDSCAFVLGILDPTLARRKTSINTLLTSTFFQHSFTCIDRSPDQRTPGRASETNICYEYFAQRTRFASDKSIIACCLCLLSRMRSLRHIARLLRHPARVRHSGSTKKVICRIRTHRHRSR